MANLVNYGFLSLEDLYAQRVNTVGIDRVYDAVQASVDEYNRIINTMQNSMVERTTMVQEWVELPGGGTLQPLTPDGNPLPVVPSGAFTVGYPITGAGTAWGTNRITREMLTVQEADRFTDDAFQKDADWRMRHLLAAILDETTWTFTDKYGGNGTKGLGAVSVVPLANGDTNTYMRRGGTSSADDHYLAQAAAIADVTNPFPAIRAELIEHPGNTGPIVAYVSSSLIATTTALAEFVEANDEDITYDGADNLPNAPANILGPGDEILGKLKSSNIWIVEWSRIPDGYIVAQSLGAGPFVKQRELPAPSLQGLFTEGFDVDGNHTGQRFLRWAGYGVFNRTAAVVQRIGDAAYATPAGFDAPQGV
ncbi:MAG: hypothetical protein ACTS5I_00875 [Rhodanobacter sp.]